MENNERLRRRMSKLEALVATLTRTAEQQAKVIQQQAGMIEKMAAALEDARRARKRLRFGRGRRGRNRSVRDDLHRHATEYFTFLRQANVEATNYHAEQAIRPSVVNRKVWGGNRTRSRCA